MLPNLKFLIGGVVFGLLLFAVTGAGVTLPDSYTRVGAPPEIGRPMMQGMIAGEPAKAQLYAMAASRRKEELERLRVRVFIELASASVQREADLLKPSPIAKPTSGGILTEDFEAPTPRPSETTGAMPGTASFSVTVSPAETPSDARPGGLDGSQIATLPPTSGDSSLNEPVPGRMKVPLPPMRRTITNGIHRRALHHRRHRVARAPYDTLDQPILQSSLY